VTKEQYCHLLNSREGQSDARQNLAGSRSMSLQSGGANKRDKNTAEYRRKWRDDKERVAFEKRAMRGTREGEDKSLKKKTNLGRPHQEARGRIGVGDGGGSRTAGQCVDLHRSAGLEGTISAETKGKKKRGVNNRGGCAHLRVRGNITTVALPKPFTHGRNFSGE